MGKCFSLFKKNQSKNKNIVIILTGLDYSGKTTMAKRLVGEPVDNVLKTLGFSLIKLSHRKCNVSLYDLGGSSQIRGIWNKYYMDAYGIIYVVDSSDLDRLKESKTIFAELLSHENISGKPVLLLANKQDKENALDELEIVEQLNVEYIVNKFRSQTRVELCSALNSNSLKIDPNITSGYRWLIDNIIENYKIINDRVQFDMANYALQVQHDMDKWKKRKGVEEKAHTADNNTYIENGNVFKPFDFLQNGNIGDSHSNLIVDTCEEFKTNSNVFGKISVTSLIEVVREQKQKLNHSYHKHKKKFGRFNKTAPLPMDTIIKEESYNPSSVRMISVKPCSSSRSFKNVNYLQSRPKTAPSVLYPIKYEGASWNMTAPLEGSSSATNIFTISKKTFDSDVSIF